MYPLKYSRKLSHISDLISIFFCFIKRNPNTRNAKNKFPLQGNGRKEKRFVEKKKMQ